MKLKILSFKIFLIAIFLFISSEAHAGKIADTFDDGVFGISWESAVETVQRKFPDGKIERPLATFLYSVKDGRSVFNIPREEDNYIRFSFDSDEHLDSVAIEFPYHRGEDLGQLMANLDTYFGKHTYTANKDDTPLNQLMEWPEDKGIRISLSYTPGLFSLGELIFNINYQSNTPHKITKEQMGLE